MAGPGNILIKIGAEAGQAISELTSVNKALGDTMTSSEKMGAGLRKAALPAAAALTAIAAGAIDAAKAAAEDAQAQAKLATILENTTGATDAQVASTESWISSLSQATGVADDQLRPALAKLVTATHDVGKSQELMNQALDISAATGKDVETVTAAMAKGYQGSTAALAKLVPGLSEASKNSKDFNTIMGELSQTTGGAMAASADTAAGQFAIFQNKMNELKESLGAALLPIMEQLAGVLNKLADFAAQNTTAIQILVAAVAALSAGILIANAAIKAYQALQVAIKVATAAWTAAQWLLNAALSANPIGLVVVALAALAAGLVIAYQKSDTFRAIVQAAMNGVKVAIDAVASAFSALLNWATQAFNWIIAHWKVALFFFGPIGAAVSLIASNFDAIKAAANAAWNLITDAWKVGKFAFGPIEAAVSAIASAFSSITSAVSAAIGAVQSLIGWLGKIHVPSIHIPNPFSLPGAAIPGAAATTRGLAAGRAAPSPGGLTINVYGSVDPEGTARAIARIQRNHERRLGLAW